MEGKANRASREEAERLAGYTKEEHEEAAGMPLEPVFMSQGYYGHENGCDCAVCENMYFHELHLNRVAADIEAIKQNAYQAGFNAAKRDCVTILEKMPSRVEPISGQNFTYIKKFVAIDAIQQLGI